MTNTSGERLKATFDLTLRSYKLQPPSLGLLRLRRGYSVVRRALVGRGRGGVILPAKAERDDAGCSHGGMGGATAEL
ncbi:hypothetical protein Cni_G09655 [Canna indica]|uniref:Uncharacterized protein n=1 Tax=Canna indica TaxID=4628 RepID=A0AAQ3K301_9LILI|nr:hypothetical protein Cni_G09655 [Canna indica]